MTEEEIENRILICEIKERDYLEVGNTKTANRYSNEKYKWEKLLNKLDPKKDEQLRDYKVGYNNLKLEKEKLIKYIEDKIKEEQYKMNNVRKGFHNYTIARTKRDSYQNVLERVINNNYEQ